MPDPAWQQTALGMTGPITNHFLIAPGAAEFPQIPRAIYCQAAGNATIEDAAGVSLTYALTAGQVLPFRVRKVTSATATLYGWF